MSPEQIEELKKQRQERSAKLTSGNGSSIAPNPATMTIKWMQKFEKVKIEGGREVEIPSGAFGFYKKNDDGTGQNITIPQAKFALAIIDHTLIQFNGSDFDQSTKKVTRSYWSNEMRNSDAFTTPFILKEKGADNKIISTIGARKQLKEDHVLKAALHIIYGLTAKGEIVKLMLPYYSYTLGSAKFKTHGDTLLDADAASKKVLGDNGGMMNCWLEYDGLHELTTGQAKYTSPKFKFTSPLNDEMFVALDEKCALFDDWYSKYHQSNLDYIDRGGAPAKDPTHQGESRHGAESQETPTSEEDSNEYLDDDDIPF